MNFGGTDLVNSSAVETDIFVVKFDSTSMHEWSKSFGGKTSDIVSDIATDSANHILITGSSTGAPEFGGGALLNLGKTDGFLTKLDTAGAHVWSKRFGDAMDQTGLVLAIDLVPSNKPSNQIVLAALLNGTTDFGTGPLTSPSPAWGGATLVKLEP